MSQQTTITNTNHDGQQQSNKLTVEIIGNNNRRPRHAATQDYDELEANSSGEGEMEPMEGGHASGATASFRSTRSGQQQQQQQQQQQPQLSGHHNAKSRLIYLVLLAFSIFTALIGLSLILIWLLKFRPVNGFGLSDKVQLANIHVLLMFSFMVSLNMYAVLIYRTHYSQKKQQLKWAHAILTGVNMMMALLGVAAMYKSHLMGNMANFYSLHSWIGALTNIIFVLQFSVGFISFLKPSLSSAEARQMLMPWHRLVGILLVLLAALAAITGISEMVIFQDKAGAYSSFGPITFIANFAGICVILVTATTVYLLTDRQYLRPALPEELAGIKR